MRVTKSRATVAGMNGLLSSYSIVLLLTPMTRDAPEKCKDLLGTFNNFGGSANGKGIFDGIFYFRHRFQMNKRRPIGLCKNNFVKHQSFIKRSKQPAKAPRNPRRRTSTHHIGGAEGMAAAAITISLHYTQQ